MRDRPWTRHLALAIVTGLAASGCLGIPFTPRPIQPELPPGPRPPRTEAQTVDMVVNTPPILNFVKSRPVVHGRTMAILGIQDPGGAQTGGGGGALVSDALAINFQQSGRMKVVERQQIERIIQEAGIGIRGADISREQAQRIGLLAKANYLLAGSLTEYSSQTRDVQLGRVITREERERYQREYEQYRSEAPRYNDEYRKFKSDFDQWAIITYMGNPMARQMARQQVEQGGRLPPVKSPEDVEEEVAARGKRSELATVANIGVTLRVFDVETGEIVYVGQGAKRHTSLHEGLTILTGKLVEDFLREGR